MDMSFLSHIDKDSVRNLVRNAISKKYKHGVYQVLEMFFSFLKKDNPLNL